MMRRLLAHLLGRHRHRCLLCPGWRGAPDRPTLARHIDRCHTDVQIRQFLEARR